MARSWKPKTPPQVTTPIAVLVMLLILFVSVGYYLFTTVADLPPDNSGVIAELEANRLLWDERRPPGFRYVVDRECRCSDEDNRAYTVTERSGSRDASFPVPVEAGDGRVLGGPTRPLWIADLFRIVEEADAAGHSVAARFDPNWGYPMQVIVRHGNGEFPVEEVYEVRDFEVVVYE